MYVCEDCGWICTQLGVPLEEAECDNCGAELWEYPLPLPSVED